MYTEADLSAEVTKASYFLTNPLDKKSHLP